METEVFKKFIENYKKDTFSHANLIETNNINKCLNDIKNLVIEMLYYDLNGNVDSSIIKRIENNTFPELTIVNSEEEMIKKEQITELQEKYSYKPTLSKNNIYVIIKPEKMNSSAANTILKFLEEPENNIIGFLITLNNYSVLPTIVSRCSMNKCFYEFENIIDSLNVTNDDYSNYIQILNIIIPIIEKHKISKLFILKKEMVNFVNTKEQLLILLKIMIQLYYNALNNYKMEEAYIIENDLISTIESNNEFEDLTRKIKTIEAAISNNNYNLNLDLSLDKLFIEMGKANE